MARGYADDGAVNVRPVALADLDWIVEVLAERRRGLMPHAPVFWAPASDAAARHREFLGSLLVDGATVALRSDRSLVVAMPRGDGWLVDDAVFANAAEARTLWAALATRCSGEVRFVCPMYEVERGAFARSVGLEVAETWWLAELPGSGGGEAGVRVALPGAEGITVAAPPVYEPPGPVLFLPSVASAAALRAALDAAPELGCAAVVVNQPTSAAAFADDQGPAGFVRHCDFYAGGL